MEKRTADTEERARSPLLPLLALLLLGTAVAQTPPPPDAGIYYEIFVRSFQDSDGDGIGDLRGATARLDHLADLGVTGIWLMPIHPSPSYHGYDVTDYYDVHPDYGTLEDLDAFLAAAHERGMEVVMDLVINHTSSEHPWFVASRAGDPERRDWYVWRDERPDGWRGTGGGPAWHAAGGDWYLGLFWSGMPDLDLRNPEVREEVYRIAEFWLERGFDGFRVDAIQHLVEGPDGAIANTDLNLDVVRALDARVRAAKPGAFIVGETWTAAPTVARYLEEAALDVAFDYPLWDALISSVSTRSPTDLVATLETAERLYPEGARLATFLTNHDQVRPATSLAFLRPDPERLRLAAGLLLTLPGTPFLYYGEEIGLPNGPGERDEAKRTPMRWTAAPGAGFSDARPWIAFSTDDPAVSVEAQAADPGSLLSWYRDLIALRRAHPALAGDGLRFVETGEGRLLAFERTAPGERLLVLASFDNRPLAADLAPLGAAGAERLLGGGTAGATLELPPLGVEVLRLEPQHP